LRAQPCDLPEPPDATLIAVSRERTVDVVAELNAMGAGGAVSIVGEFAETGEDGAALQARLVAAAGDLALVGPNCLGVMNMFDGMAVWGGDNVFSPVAGDGVALISQSGYVAYSVTNVEQALPLGYAISMGNQAVLNVADYIDAMLDDPRVRAIGLYLEGIVDIAAFSAAALRAVKQGVPLVALKAGGTQESAELAQSHSGTLAVDNEIWSALFRRLAIVEAGSPKALIEALKLLGSPKPPKGNRIVAAANSGGYAAMIGEKGRDVGLEFPAPTEAQRNALRQTVPELVSLMNPLDWNLPWAAMSTPDTSDNGMGILMDDRCDLLVYFVDWPRDGQVADVWWPTLEGLIQLNNRAECPVVIASVFPDGLPADLRAPARRGRCGHAARFGRHAERIQRSGALSHIARKGSGRCREPSVARSDHSILASGHAERGRRQGFACRAWHPGSDALDRHSRGGYCGFRRSWLSAGGQTAQCRSGA